MARITAAAFRKAAMAMPEAIEAPHFERTSFRVGKKIFATMTADGTEAMVKVTPKERVHALLDAHPGAFFSYGGWTERLGALGIRLGKADSAIVRALLIDAWRQAAPKRLRSE